MNRFLYIILLLIATVTTGWSQYTVTSLLDDGNDGVETTLREAIDNANLSSTTVTIDFTVSGTINVEGSSLPTLGDNITLDGGGNIIIDGNLLSNGTAFQIVGNNVTVKNLTISSFDNAVIVSGTSTTDAVIETNTITDMAVAGIVVEGANTLIKGNTISKTGLTGNGVYVAGGATNTTIGGQLRNSSERNIIYGFKNGVLISNNAVSYKNWGTTVIGNIIGQAGSLPESCGGSSIGGANERGIYIQQYAYNVLIGDNSGTSEQNANIIAGNTKEGIKIGANVLGLGGDNLEGITIVGNYIGVDACSNVHSNLEGIMTHANSSGVMIGGLGFNDVTDLKANIISGNSKFALNIDGEDHQVLGNIIGTDRIGNSTVNAVSLRNGHVPDAIDNCAVLLDGTSSNILFKKNTIVQSFKNAIHARGKEHQLVDNNIGYQAIGGGILLPNLVNGIVVYNDTRADFATGGTIIKGNAIVGHSSGAGIRIVGIGVTIQGNYVGYARETPLIGEGNDYGIQVLGSEVLIGASDDPLTQGNFIMGNATAQVYINGGFDIDIKANKIGLNHLGNPSTTLPRGSGVLLDNDATNVTIGGDRLQGYGNHIAGNEDHGIYLLRSIGTNVFGNIIGREKASSPLNHVNERHGISLAANNSQVTIGSPLNNQGNIIAANNKFGIILEPYTNAALGNHIIQSNYIGTNPSDDHLANVLGGMKLRQSPNVLVGGTSLGEGNVIAHNLVQGILINGSTGAPYPNNINAIGNQIYDNTIAISRVNTVNDLSIPPTIGAVDITGVNELTINVTSTGADEIDVYATSGVVSEIVAYIGRVSVTGSGDVVLVSTNLESDHTYFVFTSTKNGGNGTSSFSAQIEAGETIAPCGIANYVVSAPVIGDQKVDIQESQLHLSLNTGAIHELYADGATWSFDRQIRVTPLKTESGSLVKIAAGKNYDALLYINEVTPSADYIIDFSDIREVVEEFKFECFVNEVESNSVANGVGITNSLIVAETNFEVNEIHAIKRNIKNKASQGIQVINPKATKTESRVTFEWQVPVNVEFPSYDLQVLELEPAFVGNPLALEAEVNWDLAPVIEVDGKPDVLGVVSYTMSLTEGSGYYVWRVRPIGNYYDGERGEFKNYGTWSTEPVINESALYTTVANNYVKVTPVKLNHINNGAQTGYLFYYDQFDDDVNFIYSKVLSEGSRQAETITYADGISRVHQVQTRLQSEDAVIATQSVHDFTGRVALQTLPAPVNDPSSTGYLGYEEDFMKIGNVGFNAENFDANDKVFSIDPLEEVVGATVTPNDYYSERNVTAEGKFVADANGKPYSRTIFSNDPTGRVIQQSGPGEAMKLTSIKDGTPKNTLTAYGSVSQDELDDIFGIEAPNAIDVYKVNTLDPNGVLSVAFIDKAGRTIATALNADDLVEVGKMETVGTGSGRGNIRQITQSMKGGEIDPSTNSISRVQSVTVEGPVRSFDLSYTMTPETFEMLGGTSPTCSICMECDYTLEITIKELNPDLQPGVNEYIKLKLDPLANCSLPGTVQFSDFTVQGTPTTKFSTHVNNNELPNLFSISLDRGQYLIEKKVSVNNLDGDELYIDKKVREMRESYADWDHSDVNTYNCFDDFSETNPITACDGPYCDVNGVFLNVSDSQGPNYVTSAPASGATGMEHFDELVEILALLINVEQTPVYKAKLIKSGGFLLSNNYAADAGTSEKQAIRNLLYDWAVNNASKTTGQKTCKALKEAYQMTINLLLANGRQIAVPGSLPMKAYLPSQSIEEGQEEQYYNDEFDALATFFKALEGDFGVNLNMWTIGTGQTHQDILDFWASTKTSSASVSGCGSGCNDIRYEVKTYLKRMPQRASGSYSVRITGTQYMIMSIDGTDINNGDINVTTGTVPIVILGQSDYIEIIYSHFAANQAVDSDVDLEWDINGYWEKIPPYYFIPFCDVKTKITSYTTTNPPVGTNDDYALKIPINTIDIDTEAGAQAAITAGTLTEKELKAFSILDGFYSNVTDKRSVTDYQYVAEDVRNEMTLSLSDVANNVCEAYEYLKLQVTPTNGDQLYDSNLEELQRACLDHCAGSESMFNTAIDQYVQQQRALLGEPTQPYGANGLLPWTTTLPIEAQDVETNRDCHIEAMMTACMNKCDINNITSWEEVMNGVPVFKPENKRELTETEFKEATIDFIYKVWEEGVIDNVNFIETSLPTNITVTTMFGSQANNPALSYNLQTTPLVVEYAVSGVKKVNMFHVTVGSAWDAVNDDLVMLSFFIRNDDHVTNGNLFMFDFSTLNTSYIKDISSIFSIEKQLFDLRYDCDDLIHVEPQGVFKSDLDLLSDVQLAVAFDASSNKNVTLADFVYQTSVSVSNHNHTGIVSGNYNAEIQFLNGQKVPLMENGLAWKSEYSSDLNQLNDDLMAAINVSSNGLRAELFPSNSGLRVMMDECVVPLNADYSPVFVENSTVGDGVTTLSTISNTSSVLSESGRFGSTDVIASVFEYTSSVPSYTPSCPYGYESLSSIELASSNLLANGEFLFDQTCYDNGGTISCVFDNCLSSWYDFGTKCIDPVGGAMTSDLKHLASTPGDGYVRFFSNDVSNEWICQNYKFVPGIKYELAVMIKESTSPADPLALNRLQAVLDKGNDRWINLNSATYQDVSLNNTSFSTGISSSSWNEGTTEFVADEAYNRICFIPLSNPTKGVRLDIDDVLLKNISAEEAMVKSQFAEKAISVFHNTLSKYLYSGYDGGVADRTATLRNNNGVVQTVEFEYQTQGSPVDANVMKQDLGFLSITLEQDCNGTIETSNIQFSNGANWPAFTPVTDEYIPTKDLIDLKLNEYGALEIYLNHANDFDIPANNATSSTYFNMSPDMGVVIFDENGVEIFSNNPTLPFWNGVFGEEHCNTAPSAQTCDACIKWQHISKFSDQLPREPQPPMFTQVNLGCDEINAGYIQEQADLYIAKKLNEAETEAREAFKTNCLSSVEDELTFKYSLGLYHFTKYYYDRSGNLIQTTPPQDLDGQGDPVTKNMVTNYEYNSIGQLIRQTTPDGGLTSFWYNYNGQLVLSQDAEQARVDAVDGKVATYSYTRYDKLGRIVEVGEMDPKTNSLIDLETGLKTSLEFPDNIAGIEKGEVNTMFYNDPVSDLGVEHIQEHLRNRISYVVRDIDGDPSTKHDYFATYYSYDPHGNVTWLIQEIPEIGRKKIAYEYDLVSGNVNKVIYQPGTLEQFIHKYEYDEDNRIENVYTSIDNVSWTKEAAYDYYLHGPLKRSEIGHDNIQGCDFVYTIEGYLKAMNEASLVAANDPGQDGVTVTTGGFLGDEFGMELGYYDGDYTRTGTNIGTQGGLNPWNATTLLGNHELHNGNIAYWMSNTRSGENVEGVLGSHMRVFKYDVLNRLRDANYVSQVSGGGWNIGTDKQFDEEFTYDGNGNILTIQRHGKGQKMIDNLTYNYYQEVGINSEVSNPLKSNRLSRVDESLVVEPEGNGDFGDLLDQGVNNYEYDAEGNLTQDASELTKIDWNVLNKVERVTKYTSSSMAIEEEVIKFEYDAGGNRVAKKKISDPVNSSNVTEGTYYVRDASGNIMGVYEKEYVGGDTKYMLTERPIYGSERIGQLNDVVIVREELGSYTDENTYVTLTESPINNIEIEGAVFSDKITKSANENLLLGQVTLGGQGGVRAPSRLAYIGEDSYNSSVINTALDELGPDGALALGESKEGNVDIQFYASEVPNSVIPQVGGVAVKNLEGIYSQRTVSGTEVTTNNAFVTHTTLEGVITERLDNNLQMLSSESTIEVGAVTVYSGIVNFPTLDWYTFSLDVEDNDLLNDNASITFIIDETVIISNDELEHDHQITAGPHVLHVIYNVKTTSAAGWFTLNMKNSSNVVTDLTNSSNVTSTYYDYTIDDPYLGVLTNGDGNLLLDPNFEIKTGQGASAIIPNPEDEFEYYLVTTHGNDVYWHLIDKDRGVLSANNLINSFSFNQDNTVFATWSDYTENGNNLLYMAAKNVSNDFSIYSMEVSGTGITLGSAQDNIGTTGGAYPKELVVSPSTDNLLLAYTASVVGGSSESWLKVFPLVNGNISGSTTTQVISTDLNLVDAEFSSTGDYIYYFIGNQLSRVQTANLSVPENVLTSSASSTEMVDKSWLQRGSDHRLYYTNPVTTQGGAGIELYQLNIGDASIDNDLLTIQGTSENLKMSELLTITDAAKNNTIIYDATLDNIIAHTIASRKIGLHSYEHKDHLGNVRAVLKDLRNTTWLNGVVVSAEPVVSSWSDYFAFGWEMPGRTSVSSPSHRYAFNGKEKDSEWGGGAVVDYGFRIYDTRLGRFLSIDPLSPDYPWYTPYQYAGNKPTWKIDLDGLEEKDHGKDAEESTQEAFVGNPHQAVITAKVVEEVVKQGATWTFRGFMGAVGAIVLAVMPANNGDGADRATIQGNDNARYKQLTERPIQELSEQEKVELQNLKNKGVGGEAFSAAQKRQMKYMLYSPEWASGSQKAVLEKFAKGVEGKLSEDGVKTRYYNPETGIEVVVDNENNYFRIKDTKKKQFLDLNGKLPKTGHLNGKEANNEANKKTHIKNTDK